MNPRKSIDDFLSQRTLAVIGVSRDSRKFANVAYRFLKDRSYTVYPVNPNTERVENDRCYPTVKSLPQKVDGALVLLPPEKTVQVLPHIAEAGIQHIWFQQGTESPEAIKFCQDHHIKYVSRECIMMYIEPLAFPHRLHRWIKKVTGSYPT